MRKLVNSVEYSYGLLVKVWKHDHVKDSLQYEIQTTIPSIDGESVDFVACDKDGCSMFLDKKDALKLAKAITKA